MGLPQAKVLTSLVRNSSPRCMRWIISIILKDIRVCLSPHASVYRGIGQCEPARRDHMPYRSRFPILQGRPQARGCAPVLAR